MIDHKKQWAYVQYCPLKYFWFISQNVPQSSRFFNRDPRTCNFLKLTTNKISKGHILHNKYPCFCINNDWARDRQPYALQNYDIM